jgi:hypothetical protein
MAINKIKPVVLPAEIERQIDALVDSTVAQLRTFDVLERHDYASEVTTRFWTRFKELSRRTTSH